MLCHDDPDDPGARVLQPYTSFKKMYRAYHDEYDFTTYLSHATKRYFTL